DIQKPGGNISGVRDTSPTQQQIELIQEILPNLKTLGVVYGVDDDNLISPILRINDIALDLGIDAEVLTVLTPEDAIVAANSLTGSVDAIYIPGGDQIVAGALDDIVQSAKDNQVPVFGGDVEAVEKGAIATVSFDYYDIGRQTGAMVVKVLRGNRPSDLAVEGVKDLKISVNPTAAATMGVTLPDSVTSRATTTIPSPPNTP
ncbi:MAG: ABC transporter substrate-binding protein, partial [Cyanobacteria bacterium P01_F01_bin.3]